KKYDHHDQSRHKQKLGEQTDQSGSHRFGSGTVADSIGKPSGGENHNTGEQNKHSDPHQRLCSAKDGEHAALEYSAIPQKFAQTGAGADTQLLNTPTNRRARVARQRAADHDGIARNIGLRTEFEIASQHDGIANYFAINLGVTSQNNHISVQDLVPVHRNVT